MNFDDAIKAHSDWKLKLQRYLKFPDQTIDVNNLSKDNVCALGCWLYGEGSSFRHLPEYDKLKQEHAAFHQAAADIVRRKDTGENVLADIALGSNSPFAKHSENVVSLLLVMKKHAAK